MRTIFTGLFVMASMPFLASAAPTTGPAAGPAAASGAGFAAALYNQLATGRSGNLLFSPYSIRTALAMPYVGSAGATSSQMQAALDLPPGPPTVAAKALGAVMKTLNTPSDAFQLKFANGLWGQAGYPFRPLFSDVLSRDFGATLQQADFVHAAEPARAAINGWVAKQTHDKIQNLLPAGSVNTATRLVLANAIYFKGTWEQPFDKLSTRPEPFHLTPTNDAAVPMMHAERHGPAYFENDLIQAVELPYRGGDVAMLLLVPKAVDGLPHAGTLLQPTAMTQLLAGLQPRTVRLALPKLKLTGSFSLRGPLAAMGMPDAFDGAKADFSGMVGVTDHSKPLVISDVYHKAFAAVDEEGTEAAAATGITMRATAMRRLPQDVVTVNADRPFLFVIRHRPSGSILFIGRVVDPRS